MIPCFICGKDIGGGWSIGYPPAPDSQKMGLCFEHDLQSHRERVQKAWQSLIYNSLAENVQSTAYRAGDIPQLLSIYFTGGGSVSLPCSSCTVLEGKTLKVITPAGEHIFFPLGQVRNYALSPLEPAAPPEPREAKEVHTPLPGEEPDEDSALPLEAAGDDSALPQGRDEE